MSCKPTMRMSSTEDYDALTDLYMRNDLEFSPEEPVSTDTIKSWKISHGQGENEVLAAAITLAMRQGEYIIDGIATEPLYRKMKLGKILLDKAISEVKVRGGKRLYLVARAPEFFKKSGFVTVEREKAPTFFECLTCPQYGKTCHPEVMRLDF